MRAIHTSERERQRRVDPTPSFRNPLPVGRRVSGGRSRKPILQLQGGFPQRALVQASHQIQHISACSTRETVEDLAPQVHVKRLPPFSPVEGTPPPIPSGAPPCQILHLITPQHGFHRYGLLDGGEAHCLALHAATSRLLSRMRLWRSGS